MVNAMSTLRCFARTPGIPESVPMKVEENGWPTFPGRSRAMQAEVLDVMVNAVHDFRGTYNVTDYRWFNLRDGDTSSPQPFQHFGLFDSSYVEKPAFAVYRRLVDRLARSEPAPAPRPRCACAARRGFDRAGAAAPAGASRATVTRPSLIRHARFRLGGRRFRLDRRPLHAASCTAPAAGARTATSHGPRCGCATAGWCGCGGRSAPAR